jgi:hypothetical protein
MHGFANTISFLEEIAVEFNVTMTLDVPSAKALSELSEVHSPRKNANINFFPKLNFPVFIELLAGTDFVTTGSGGCRRGVQFLDCLVSFIKKLLRGVIG